MTESFTKDVVGIGSLSPVEKKLYLFKKQKNVLDLFLEHGAISQAQHDKSMNDLIVKMGIGALHS